MAAKRKKKAVDDREMTHAAALRNTRLLVVLLCIALSALAVVPFFFMGSSEEGDQGLTLRMPVTHDMFLQYDQMRSFYNGLAAGEIYPRWEEDTNRGFGAATTSYYPPGVYYLTSALYAVTGDWLRTLLDAHLLMMIASAAALYLYAREVMGRRAAVAAMAAYIFLPYHIADQYQRGALAELMGFIWMPLILLFSERLMEQSSAQKVSSKLLCTAWLALSYGCFLWSHPPTAYQFTMGFGVYVAVRALMTRRWKGLIWVGAGVVAGLGLSAAYLLPALIEQDLIHREFIADVWPYHKTYIFVHDLYGTDLHRGFFHSLDAMWIFGAIVIVASALLVRFKLPASLIASELRRRTTLWIVLGSFASFMMLELSQPLGMLIPKIDIGVFTWRMLSITTLVMALLTGACAQAAIESSKKRLHLERRIFGSLALAVLIGGVCFSAGLAARQVSAPVFVPESEHFNAATLPRTAPAEPESLPVDAPRAELANDSGTVAIDRWDPEHRRIRVEPQAEDRLVVRTFNFPGWTATVDGKRVEIDTVDEVGQIGIDLQPGAHEVALDFRDTPVRIAARNITLVSLGLLFALCCAPLARRAIRAKRAPD
ncbi:MAG TPA: hypothetical protein VLU47_13165 [Blastocatellia bacterium]|nr:hypothetical protein [Blastocatellia bacterium]